MEPHPRLSIIIPVFNIALYLDACVRSVLNQSFTDFELLLMDDGSTDGSGELCNALADTDSRIRVRHLSHRGPSAARNAGIDAASGDYIGFVDGDDWIEPDMYALLHENSVTYGADLSACGFIKITDIQAMAFSSAREPVTCYTPAQALQAIFRPDHMRYSACNKLFRRRLFEAVRFPEGRTYEDKATIYRLIHQCSRIVWCASPKYHYFMRPDSIMHRSAVDRQADLFLANEELMAFIAAHYPTLRGAAGASYAAECLRLLKDPDPGHLPARRCQRIIRRYLFHSMASQNLDFSSKIQLLQAACLPPYSRILKKNP